MPTRCAIYCRVSTDAQERDGTSLGTQERACLAHAAQQRWMVIGSYRDTASGFNLDRPGLAEMRHLVRSGEVDVVLCHDLDRLSRKQTHVAILVEEADDYGVQLAFVLEQFEDTATGQFLRSARAFAAELEREKIAERTMRGKAERARSGRLPQGTGKGCYGYVYNADSGRREIYPAQAAIVARIFQRYAEARSFSAVSGELNDAGIPALGGGRWYPLTIRNILTNETYVGRLVYRRTKRITTRTSSGRRTTKVIEQPEEHWITVPDGAPALVDEALWQRVQAIIRDPERLRRRPEGRAYLLGGRIRCGLCGAAMVGQTLQLATRPYRYYRCRHVYDKNTSRSCTARYVAGDVLEQQVWDEVTRILANPAVVLQELAHASTPEEPSGVATGIERDLAQLVEREKRLVRLYSLGEVDEALLREQLADVRWQRSVLEERLHTERRPIAARPLPADEGALHKVCAAITAYLENATFEQRILALEALKVAVTATREQATLTGVLPLEAPQFSTDEGTSRCLCSGR